MKQALLAMLIFLFAESATAFVCTTRIDAVYVDQTGTVAVRGTDVFPPLPASGWQVLCNLNRPDSVGPNVCTYWLATAMQVLGEQPTTMRLQTTYNVSCGQNGAFPNSVVMLR
jgi:hypothetical protein